MKCCFTSVEKGLQISNYGCEGDLAAISVTPLISRVDQADLAGQAGVPFLPRQSMCVPPEASLSVKEGGRKKKKDFQLHYFSNWITL